MESYVYDPFLLPVDERMEADSILSGDVHLGLTADPVFVSKESPSHQSDSGCSDMYDDRSVTEDIVDMSPVVSEDDMIEILDFNSVIYNDDDLDKELSSYLGTPGMEKPVFEVQKQISPRTEVSSPEIDVDSDSSDPDYMPEKRVVQARLLRPKTVSIPRADIIQALPAPRVVHHDIRVLQNRPCVNTTSNLNATKPPAVKVVKVIKTAATTKSEVDNELMKALDDRNKKNAVQAKINRERKKVYIKSLEDEIDDLKSENTTLKTTNQKNEKENKALNEEVEYLKSVLANQSALAGLLKNISSVSNVKLSSSIGHKRNIGSDHDYHSAKRLKSTKTAGVCLHVDDGNVSLEFCSKCASMSKVSSEDDNC